MNIFEKKSVSENWNKWITSVNIWKKQLSLEKNCHSWINSHFRYEEMAENAFQGVKTPRASVDLSCYEGLLPAYSLASAYQASQQHLGRVKKDPTLMFLVKSLYQVVVLKLTWKR